MMKMMKMVTMMIMTMTITMIMVMTKITAIMMTMMIVLSTTRDPENWFTEVGCSAALETFRTINFEIHNILPIR